MKKQASATFVDVLFNVNASEIPLLKIFPTNIITASPNDPIDTIKAICSMAFPFLYYSFFNCCRYACLLNQK